jgi:hypothetical protein
MDACDELLAVEEIKRLEGALYFRFYDDTDWDGFVSLLSDHLVSTFVAADFPHYRPTTPSS